jgi:hypothetical protein
MIRTAVRGLAIAVALVAIVDPAVSVNRSDTPLLSVVAADAEQDAELTDRLVHTLRRDFIVVKAPLAAADAGVIVGRRVPHGSLPPRLHAVVPGARPALVVEGAQFPVSVHRESLARVRVVVRGREDMPSLTLALSSGDILLDRATIALGGREGLVDTTLTFMPSVAGTMALTLTATSGRAVPVRVSGLVDVRESPWRVLVHDARPSWMSTFVRRAIEEDGRFRVASRIATSRGIATSAGGPPPGLGDPAHLADYDVILIGAAAGLSAGDVRGLEEYMRRRGGSVVVLLDEVAAGPLDRLLRAEWRTVRAVTPAQVAAPAGGMSLRASALAWPVALPPGAEALAVSDTSAGLAGRPVVWQAPVGAGRMIVSGAIDAWHFRDPDQSGFAAFWADVVGSAAAAAMPAISVRLGSSALHPGDSTSVVVTVRDLVLGGTLPGSTVRLDATARLVSGSDTIALALWPTGGIGTLRGTLRAPATTGPWRVEVETDRGRSGAGILVTMNADLVGPDEPQLVAALVASRGGETVEAARSAELAGLLRSSLDPDARLERWHPMRSPWWIVPFALALGYEWWSRRRRGLA